MYQLVVEKIQMLNKKKKKWLPNTYHIYTQFLHLKCVSRSVVSNSLRPHGHGVPHGAPPGSSVHGILQARILEWVAIPPSRGSSQPRDWTQVYRTAGRFFTVWASREALSSSNNALESVPPQITSGQHFSDFRVTISIGTLNRFSAENLTAWLRKTCSTKGSQGTSLVVQRLTICLSRQKIQVQSLVGELRSHIPRVGQLSPRAVTREPAGRNERSWVSQLRPNTVKNK